MEDNQKKRNVLLKFEHNFNLQLIVCVLLSSVAIMGILIISKILDSKKFREYSIVNDINLVNSIESIIYKDNNLILNGYAFLLDRNSNDSYISVFLRNVDTMDEIWLDTEQITRTDISSYFDCEHYYGNSGFIASTNVKKVDNDAPYEIIINIDYINENDNILNKKVRKTVSAGQYILNEKLYAYNPYEFDMPNLNIESDLIKNVFNYGDLCIYLKEYGVYVYQYQGKLYWIATEDFQFNDDETIMYHIHAYSKLSENRKQYIFKNMSFIFEQYEYTDEVTHPYRVAILDIPNDYAIIYVTTGVYSKKNEKSVWFKNFHLNYVFN